MCFISSRQTRRPHRRRPRRHEGKRSSPPLVGFGSFVKRRDIGRRSRRSIVPARPTSSVSLIACHRSCRPTTRRRLCRPTAILVVLLPHLAGAAIGSCHPISSHSHISTSIPSACHHLLIVECPLSIPLQSSFFALVAAANLVVLVAVFVSVREESYCLPAR